jgi:hypothetical protein
LGKPEVVSIYISKKCHLNIIDNPFQYNYTEVFHNL